MTIALIRHGQTAWNFERRLQGTTDIPLNDTGREQAATVAPRLTGTWDVVVSSPLGRARETAQIIADALGLELGPTYTDVVERHYGDAEGATAQMVVENWPDHQYPNLETEESVIERGLRGIEAIARDYPGRNVLVVSHGTLIRLTLSHLSGTTVPPLENCSVSVIEATESGWSLLDAGTARTTPSLETALSGSSAQ
ncbi:probable phosphoglycerate mutase [Plantibacter flavus]|uniref:Putative phosphoglycerate mutase n=1 Tax=Plantibacter flavus TaxID=150123 RepID=A0A3N2C5X3_9MICO|nr:histidine phosphatase family protein [Plantibacter flavus]ROR82882.1 putative phosphoglycerate mutase [Plantibacter flavus]SMG40891.1 probable phosphoglycerate mutase [Plantibacter flavus]